MTEGERRCVGRRLNGPETFSPASPRPSVARMGIAWPNAQNMQKVPALRYAESGRAERVFNAASSPAALGCFWFRDRFDLNPHA